MKKIKVGESDVPLCIGIVYNVKKKENLNLYDAEVEYDSMDTVNNLKRVIENEGHKVVLLEADDELINKIKVNEIDFVFNIAEGKNSRGREGQVPAILSMLDIPFSGSDQTTLCIAQDKTVTKKLLSTFKVLSPRSLLMSKNTNLKKIKLNFPLIVKPNAEGSSKGISEISIAKNLGELQNILHKSFESYNQEILVEEYIDGKEFTVGVLGNGKDTVVFSPMEIIYKRPTQENFCVYSYAVKQDYKNFVDYTCQSNLDIKVLNKMKKISLKIFNALECKDFSRIDFRVSKDNKIYFIEINPLPGLAPNYSDYPMLAEKCRVDYDSLIKKILHIALKRNNLEAK